jgi:hypothetical protein
VEANSLDGSGSEQTSEMESYKADPPMDKSLPGKQFVVARSTKCKRKRLEAERLLADSLVKSAGRTSGV